MASTNYSFNNARIAQLIWEDQADNSDSLETSVDFDAPISNGKPTATITVVRTYTVPAETAKDWLKLSM